MTEAGRPQRVPPRGTTYHLKAIVKLDKPVKVDHPIRKPEYWSLERLGVEKIAVLFNKFSCVGKSS